MNLNVPPGYVELVNTRAARFRGMSVVARADVADAVREIMAQDLVYAWAQWNPSARALEGRVPAYAVVLPKGGGPAVVRHNHHGGLLAAIRGDGFFRPRAPRELANALRLAAGGVPTPDVLAYFVYGSSPLHRRSDVITRELPAGRDFGAVLRSGSPTDVQLRAVRALLGTLAAAGAHHPDLNVKNVYLTDDAAPTSYVLDVDRVRFTSPADAERKNAARIARSLRKYGAGGLL